jgi:transposase
MLTDMENWAEIRRRVLVDEQSKRSVCREFDIHWDTLQKILDHPEPPGYRRTAPRPRPKLDPFLPVIHQILQDDKKAPRKQRHTARRIFQRLRDEYGYTGGLTVVKDAVRAWRRTRAEVFVPLAHRPGEAQVDFGEAEVALDGPAAKVALFVMTMPYSDATFCCAFPRECTEAFLEGHVRAFAFLGGVPRRISYDNSKIAVAKIVGSRDRKVTDAFLRIKSHHLFESHFCLVRRPNEKGHVETLIGYARPQLPRAGPGRAWRPGAAQRRPGGAVSCRPPAPTPGQARDQGRVARRGAARADRPAEGAVLGRPGRTAVRRLAVAGPLRHQ